MAESERDMQSAERVQSTDTLLNNTWPKVNMSIVACMYDDETTKTTMTTTLMRGGRRRKRRLLLILCHEIR